MGNATIFGDCTYTALIHPQDHSNFPSERNIRSAGKLRLHWEVSFIIKFQ